MSGGLNAIANLLGRVDANNALVVAFDSTVPVTATRFLGDDGTAALPTFSFSGTGDGDNGMYLSGADTLGWSAGGTLRLSLSSTAVTSTVPIKATDYVQVGTDANAAAGGAVRLAGGESVGWETSGVDWVGLRVSGGMLTSSGGTVNPTDWRLSDTTNLSWSDVSLSRGAANRLDLATGDSLYLVSGGLGVGSTPGSAGTITASSSISGSGNIITDGAAANMGPTGAGAKFYLANPLIFNTAPTVTSAGTSPSVTASNGTAAFRVNVGTGGTATTIVMAMPAATTGWNASATNLTATAANRADQHVVVTASTTTSLTLQNQTISTGAALAFTASDIVQVVATAF